MTSAVNVLGISAFYHDSAAALVRDGEVIAAQEERFTRKRHDADFPRHAVQYCLHEAGLTPDELTAVVFYEKPFLKFERLLMTYLENAPRGFVQFVQALPVWLREKLWIPDTLRRELGEPEPRWWSRRRVRPYAGELLFTEHHESHAASAFLPSPFEEAAILTVDGVGEWATTSLGHGRGSEVRLEREIHFPHSLGLLYSAFTYFTGFKVNSAEYKVMGLAPYGEPKYAKAILEHVVHLADDGSFELNLEYFDYVSGLRMTSKRMDALFDGPARKPSDPLTQREMDLARSVQVVLEEALLRLARELHRRTGAKDLCMAGGVALNCVANTRLLREGPFERIWVQPAAGDAGGALGAALLASHGRLGVPRRAGADRMRGALLGPSYGDDEIAEFLAEHGIPAERSPPDAHAERVAALVEQELVVGLFQGRMEFGPRALGSRSIIGDPRSPRMQSVMNLKIKQRESFRPFAPAVLREHAERWFDHEPASPYMLFVADLRAEHRLAHDESAKGLELLYQKRSTVPAITHVDYSARLQTVDRADNPGFHAIIDAFHRRTGCPMLINTSFNVRGEPIVCTPKDAYVCFMTTEMDALVLGSFILRREGQPELPAGWHRTFEPD